MIRVRDVLTLAATFLLISACATTGRDSVSEAKKANYLDNTSRSAFERVEPVLQRLEAGQAVDDTGLSWNAYELNSRGKLVGVVVRSDGWLPALSGGIEGAMTSFGRLSGRSARVITGQHVYGFVWGGINMVPRYLVSTEAEVVNPAEYQGTSTRLLIGPNEEIAFTDLKIKEVRRLDFPDPPPELAAGARLTTDSYRKHYLTPEQFQAGERLVTELPSGMSMLEVVRSLGGKYISDATGEDFVIYGIKGYLNISETYRWGWVDPEGLFEVWPFGFMEGTKEVPKLALIFKNGEVLKVVPFTSKAELEREFTRQ